MNQLKIDKYWGMTFNFYQRNIVMKPKNDLYLSQLYSCIEHYDLFSFDVFDTILFRTCDNPSDVFELVGKRLSEQIKGWPYSPVTYKNLRIEAANRAYGKKAFGVDCTFDEILAEMPFSPEIIRHIRQLEIECENKTLYLNENIYSFMCFCQANNKKIVITCDMYYDKEQILHFLSNAGVDISFISECFISSEYKCFKSTGELFDKMLAAFPTQNRNRIIHIGDNKKADVEGARKSGLQTVHYNVVDHEFGSFYDFEKLIYKINLPEIKSLRKLAAASNPYKKGSGKAFFYTLGAEIIGPVYSLFAEWVVHYALIHGFKIILPFMREGELLSSVITRVIEDRGLGITCTPLYISRQPAFISSILSDNYAERIHQILLRGGRTLKIVFEELGLNISESGFAEEAVYTLGKLKEDGKIGKIEKYLFTDKVKESILCYSAKQRNLLLQYFFQLTDSRKALTVDIGTKGTTERILHDIWEAEKLHPSIEHMLMLGSSASNINNILSGIPISAWLGIAGENDSLISKIKYQIQIIESLVNATCGGVLYYKEKNNSISPVLSPQTANERQKQLIQACWKGVKSFQESWISLASLKGGLRKKLLRRRKDFLSILLRLIEMPTKQESALLGPLSYLDQFNQTVPVKLSGELSHKKENIPKDIQGFISTELKNGIYWPQAIIALQLPEYFNDLLLHSVSDDPSFRPMLSILKDIQVKKYSTGVIFGASELGIKFKKLADMLKVPITCFVDSDKRLHGTTISGLIVHPLEDVPANIDYYIIASYIYANEIRATLQSYYSCYDSRPVIYDFGAQSL